MVSPTSYPRAAPGVLVSAAPVGCGCACTFTSAQPGAAGTSTLLVRVKEILSVRSVARSPLYATRTPRQASGVYDPLADRSAPARLAPARPPTGKLATSEPASAPEPQENPPFGVIRTSAPPRFASVTALAVVPPASTTETLNFDGGEEDKTIGPSPTGGLRPP